MTALMHVYTCAASLISLHPVTSPLRDKSCAEEMAYDGQDFSPEAEEKRSFYVDSHRKQTKPIYLWWKSKIHCTRTQATMCIPHLPSPAHTHTYTRTHACTNMQRTCLWLCTESFCSWGFTSCRDGVEGQFCPIVGFLQKSRLCRLPLEMCWISAFLYQLALFLHVAVIRATDKTCENELIFLLNSSNYTESK